MKPRSRLQEKKIEEAKREAKIASTFAFFKKQREPQIREDRRKIKTIPQLMEMIHTCAILPMLRSPETYIPRSHNIDRQRNGLISHMYANYPVPAFMYQAFDAQSFNVQYIQGTDILFQNWFITMAQGGSFRKATKGIMTHREAFVFLTAPSENSIHHNVWWAKMKVAGLPPRIIHWLLEKMFRVIRVDDPNGRYAELIHFFALYHEQIDHTTFGEITDFLQWKFQHDPEFSLKGRTIASVVALINEWQKEMQKAKLGSDIAWEGMGMKDWVYTTNHHVWVITELLNNKELLNEGRKQKHCVYSYVSSCASGYRHIFSLRGYWRILVEMKDGMPYYDKNSELTRVTIEVTNNSHISQVRGYLNRVIESFEMDIVRRWAGENGFTISTSCWL